MRACISTDGSSEQVAVERARQAPGLEQLDLVGEVSAKAPYEWDPEGRSRDRVVSHLREAGSLTWCSWTSE